MANYSLVIDSKFSPFTFQELLQPALMATQAHQELENQYGELAAKANIWEEMANEQTDPYAYKMYKTYARDLESQAMQLAREGLTPASRQNMLKMKQRYSSDIIPIEQAYKRRQELIDEQRKLQAQDNTLMFDRSASMMSLDDLIKNPQLTYQSYSGAALEKQVSDAAKSLSKEMRDNPRKWRSILGNQYFESIMQRGYRPEEIIQAIQNNPNASPILQSIVEDAVRSSGISKWGDKDTLNRAYKYARQGLWDAVGETQYQIQSNKAYDYAMQEQAAINKAVRGAKAPDTGLYYRAVPKTTVNGDKNTTQMGEDLKVLQEILSNPSLLDKQEKRTIREPNYMSLDPMTSIVIDTGTGRTKEETYYPYQEKLKELGKRYNLDYTIKDGVLSGGNLADVAQQISNDIRSSAVRYFSYTPNITQSDLITQVLKETARDNARASGVMGLYKLEDNKKGKAIKISDIDKYFTSDSDISFDVDLGFIINSTDDKGETRSAIIDTELFDDQERTFNRAQNSIKAALDNGEDELATLLIEATMKAFYDKFNTLEKRQSNTTSK